jgi:hypothetical protein
VSSSESTARLSDKNVNARKERALHLLFDSWFPKATRKMFPITMNAVAKRILEAQQMERGVRGYGKTDEDIFGCCHLKCSSSRVLSMTKMQ